MADSDEFPAHEVRVGDFWMAETEVTNAQYRFFDPRQTGESLEPAVEVNWDQARGYCQALGEGYDLPTEAEWEYAARAGTKTAWSFGDDESRTGEFAWFVSNSGAEAHAVRTRNPNPWGLYDMHGNVWEWVLDCYLEEAYRQRAGDQSIEDPGMDSPTTCPEHDLSPVGFRVLRGGSFFNVPGFLRSAIRSWSQPGLSLEYIGFRCVRRPVRPARPIDP